MTAFNPRAIGRLGLAVAALLFFSVAATKETQASCGDYLVIGGINHTMNQAGEEMSTSADASRTPVRSPCHGPQCRPSPAMPIPPLPVQSGPSQQERAHLQRLSDLNLPSPFWYRVVETSARSTPGFPFRLERPPHA
ncbi:MAG: hypothetical protein O3C40_07310 [Planctomycetota bacterium]|nr:hypothetical protein [Planctomycetota bacterium]